jgi:hypothetical protein
VALVRVFVFFSVPPLFAFDDCETEILTVQRISQEVHAWRGRFDILVLGCSVGHTDVYDP